MRGDEDDAFADESLSDAYVPLDEEVVFGRYRLCYELGSGGMATVYLARAEGPGRFAKAVAIKRIHPHLARRKDFVAMFLDEARIASLISHPNVCSAFDFGEVGGTYYMAMEYMVGEPLSNIERVLGHAPTLQGSARWTLLAARMVADVSEGLHAAHEVKDERGRPLLIVHRDVSPQNVFVTYEGAVKLVDFGVAFAKDRLTQTSTGTLKGKYAYMSPEQLAGAPIDRRADIWALGVMLWELLTTERLFRRRSDGETLLAVQTYQVPAPSTLSPAVGPELDAIVLRALQRDPVQRYPTARALARDLANFLARSGQGVGMAEIAELMTELFATRRPTKLGALSEVLEPSDVRRRRVTNVLPPAVRPALPSPEGHLAESDTQIRPASAPASRPIAAFDEPPAVADAAPHAGGTAPELSLAWRMLTRGGRSRSGAWLGIVAALAVAGMAAVAGISIYTARKRPSDDVEVLPPAAAPVAPTEAAVAHPVLLPPLSIDLGVAAAPDAGARPPRRTPLPPRAPAAPQLGEVALQCGTWADVFENGRPLGRTPQVVDLRAGHHVLRFRTGDGRESTTSIDVVAHRRTRAPCGR